MTQTGRQAAAVLVDETRYAPGFRSEWHHSNKAQLIYPSRGIMTLHTRAESWVIPPLRACWLPALEEHCVVSSRRLAMHSVYCDDGILERLPKRSGVVQVSSLLRELIFAIQEMGLAGCVDGSVQRMGLVLADQIKLQSPPQLSVPRVLSARLGPIAATLRSDPADSRTLQQWSDELGVSTRTLARAFERETKMSFTAYRQQARLRAAIERLATGEAVSRIAYDLGFTSASHFIEMFRKATGTTPKQYFRGKQRPTAPTIR
jgi:AraC-like DNA-binding protein